MQEQNSYPQMEQIKIDSVNDSVLSGESQRTLMSEVVQEPKKVVAMPKPKTKRVVVKRAGQKKCHSLKVEATDTQEVADAKNLASTMSRRLNVTSKMLVVIGALGFIMSLYGMIMAGRNVEWMVTRHINKQHGDQGPDARQSPMTRTEFHLIDNFRIISFFFLLKSIALMCIGGKTLYAISKSNSGFTNAVFKKNLFRIAFIVVMSMFSAHFMRDTHNVFNKHMQRYNETPHHQWQPEPMYEEEPMPMVEEEPEMEMEPFELDQDIIEEEPLSEDIDTEDSEVSTDDEETTPMGRNLREKKHHRGQNKQMNKKRLLRMLKRFSAKVADLKADAQKVQDQASDDFKQLNKYEENLRWIHNQLRNTTANSTITRDELLAMLKKDNLAILKFKELLAKTNMTISNDYKWIRIYEGKVEWVKEQLNRPHPPRPTPGNYTRDELLAMLKNYTIRANESEQAIAADKAAGNKVQFMKDWAQLKIWKAKIEWVRRQLNRPHPIPPTPINSTIPTPANYSKEQLETMLESYINACSELKNAMSKDKANGDKRQYYADLKQFKYILGNVRWAKAEIAKLSSSSVAHPAPGNYTLEQLQAFLKGYEAAALKYENAMAADKTAKNETQFKLDRKLWELVMKNVHWADHEIEKLPSNNYTLAELKDLLTTYTNTAEQARRNMGNDRHRNETAYYEDLEQYTEAMGKLRWVKKEIAKFPTDVSIPTPGNYTRAELERMLKGYIANAERYKKEMVEDKKAGDKEAYYKAKQLFDYVMRNVDWANEQLAKIPGDFTRDQLLGMLKNFTNVAEQARRNMVKDKAAGNKTQYYVDLEIYKEYMDKVKWVQKELEKIPKEPVMITNRNGFMNKVRGWFRKSHEGKFGKERFHGQFGKGRFYQGPPRGMPGFHHEQAPMELMSHVRPTVQESRMHPMGPPPTFEEHRPRFGEHQQGPQRRGHCGGAGFFKVIMFVLIGAHFYNLYKFKKALATINEGSNKATQAQVADVEAFSVAPVSIPIVMEDKQEFQAPGNYIVVQAPSQMV